MFGSKYLLAKFHNHDGEKPVQDFLESERLQGDFILGMKPVNVKFKFKETFIHGALTKTSFLT